MTTPRTVAPALPPALVSAVDAVAARRRAEVDLLAAAAEWGITHPPAEGVAEFSSLGLEGWVRLAGEGAPVVAEFAPVELAAHLGWSHEAARALIGRALELTVRLPLLWSHVVAGRVDVAVARRVAETTMVLDAGQAVRVDRQLAAAPRAVSVAMAERLVDAIRIHDDPDLIVGFEEADLAHRHVTLTHDRHHPAATRIEMQLDHHDAAAFDATVSDIAATLKALGDGDVLDVRRARAVGVMASPQTALDLLDRGVMPDRSSVAPVVDLHLHLTDTTLLEAAHGRPGAVEAESIGVLTTTLLRRWLDHPDTMIRVRPVITLPGSGGPAERRPGPATPGWTPVDRHDPPESMRTTVILRDAECVFPGCHRSSRHADLDHIQPWLDPADGGPPGQTSPHNLAPLCRTHHRFKTHTDWTYRREHDGTYTWQPPHGPPIRAESRGRRPAH
ncbi:HNH endonuclease signature motif containing protein [Alteromonas gracilis]